MMYVAGKVYEKYIESEPEPEPTVRTVEKVIYKEVDKLHKEINRLISKRQKIKVVEDLSKVQLQ